MKRNNGFSVIEVIIVIVVVALIGGIGYIAYDRFYGGSSKSDSATEFSITADDLPEAPEIETAADLDEVTSAMDSVDLDSSDDLLSDLQTELDKF